MVLGLYEGVFWAGQEQGTAKRSLLEMGVCRSWVSGSPQLCAEPWMHWAAPLGDAGLLRAASCRRLYSVRFGSAASAALFLAGCSSVAAGST